MHLLLLLVLSLSLGENPSQGFSSFSLERPCPTLGASSPRISSPVFTFAPSVFMYFQDSTRRQSPSGSVSYLYYVRIFIFASILAFILFLRYRAATFSHRKKPRSKD